GYFMICMEMSGNWFRTDGTKTIVNLLLTAVHGKMGTAPIASLAGVAGTATQISAARLPASAASLINI
ncbi:MAG: hypothetical protein QG646_1438, partial [Euryarchaeota archaeon]|nr:hypothetical protein [Euryarchaeota archaeon]